MGALLNILTGLSRYGTGMLGIGLILVYLFTATQEQLCISYPVLGGVCLIIWVSQRAVGRIEN